jgi:CubicO group peptidase (beta-lactamase class C family)
MRLLAALLALLMVCSASAAPPSLETFLDGVMAREMTASHVPGAVVLIVRDGEVVFQKGYGYANLKSRTPVSPERTIFRIGSVTKVFTALAVMQLADRGKLALTDDVNEHLRAWKVPSTYPQPITFANLLTHSSGLDEISPGRKSNDARALVPLEQFLATRIVRRQPPSTTIGYSTYNAALAGHLVETISGQHLRDYLNANVFQPLAMTRTSLGPVPPAQQRDLAAGYGYSMRSHRPLDFEYFHTYPASDINSTASDMGRFLRALLGGSKEGQARILSDAATAEMVRQHFANHPRLIGMTYGWFENRRNGVAAIEHGGVMDGYAALLYAAPRERLGIFVAANIENSGFPVAVRNAIVDHGLPPKETRRVEPLAASRKDLSRFAGSYRNDIWCHSCPAGARGFLPSPVTVTANDDGTLSLWGARWVQVEPLLFALPSGSLDNGEVVVAFREDAAGRITHFFNGAWSHERVEEVRAVAVPPATLRKYAGQYDIGPGQAVTVSVEGGRLMAELTGMPRVELLATSATTFVADGADATVTFVEDGLVLRFGGRELRAVKRK